MQTLYISKRCFLKIEKEQLVIEGHHKVHLPVEDLESVILESPQITITSACLSILAEHGCNVILCGKNHNPVALSLPFLPHSRQAMVNRIQINWSEAFKKRCHQIIIQKKIANQAKCYELLYNRPHQKLIELSRNVKLGDKGNAESYAANLYFGFLLNGKSRRNKELYYNKALNFGYAILRSKIAQELTASGFIPSIGLFHHNDLNNFNLADDIIEPYRPFVDYIVFSQLKNQKPELDKYDKSILLKLPEMELQISNKNILLSKKIIESVHSLKNASNKNNHNELLFPDLVPLWERIYE